MGQAWTATEIRILRRRYSSVAPKKIAARWLPSRRASAIVQKARKLGLNACRGISPAEVRAIGRIYPEHTLAETAQLLGRAETSILRIAKSLGIQKNPRIAGERIDRLVRLHGRGLLDAQIAERLGMKRRTITAIRRRLGLPVNAKALLRSRRLGLRHQRETLGIRNTGELHRLANRRLAQDRGWPESLRPRQVQILELLAIAGRPLTHLEIMAGIGMPRGGRGFGYAQNPKSRDWLKSNGMQGTYLGNLIRRGLVVAMPKARRMAKQRWVSLYTLSAAAIDVVLRRNRSCATA